MIRPTLRRLRRWAAPGAPEASYQSVWALADPATVTTLLPAEEVPTPETADMAFIPFSAYLDRPVYTAPAVRSTILPGARYCPTNHCVVTATGNVLLESTGPGARPVALDRRALQRPTRRIPGMAVPFRCFFDNYYHLLVDTLSRFDLLNFDPFRAFPAITLLCPGGLTPLESFFVSRLRPDNVHLLDVEPDVLYAPDQLLVNSFITARSSGYLRGPFVERLRARVRQPDGPPRRLLVSRRDAHTRQLRNEDALLDRLRPLGFEHCVPGALPIQEQIALFQHAEMVVAPHGAGLANLLFAEHATVLELFSSRHVLPHYYLLAKALGHRYDYLPGTRPHPDDPFEVDVDAVSARIDGLLRAQAPVAAPQRRPLPA